MENFMETENEYLCTRTINTVFQRFTIFILHKSNRILTFWPKIDIFIYFIVLFCPGYVLDFMMYHIRYTIHFFPKNKESYFHKPI